MAIQQINVGTAPSDQTGDTLRAGAIKINSNFTELYANNATVFDRLTAGSNVTLTKTNNNCIINAVIPTYVMPVATTGSIGGVKVDGSSITIDAGGIIHAAAAYELPVADIDTLGGVKIDNATITIDENGVISSATAYVLPIASNADLGGVRVDGASIIINSLTGVISAAAPINIEGNAETVTNGVYTSESYENPDWIFSLSYDKIIDPPAPAELYVLPVASDVDLGGVKVDGETITVDADGVISGANTYVLPVASDVDLGGVKVDGTSVTITNQVISSHVSLTRVEISGTTASLAAGATDHITIEGFRSYLLLSVQTVSTLSGGAWVRVYTDKGSRTADSARPQIIDPTGFGVITEVVTTTDTRVPITPGVIGFNDETVVTSDIELAVTNVSSATDTFTISLIVVPLEL